jgi:hypothetical protein
MREIRELRGPLGLPVERDLHFDADYGAQRRRTLEGGATHASRGWPWMVTQGLRAAGTAQRNAPSASEWVRRSAEYKPLSAYAAEAREHGRIVT